MFEINRTIVDSCYFPILFNRYLDRYEKINFLGETGSIAGDDDEDSRHKKWSARALHSVPLVYNYHQHTVNGECLLFYLFIYLLKLEFYLYRTSTIISRFIYQPL